MRHRNCKIVATIGPASASPAMLEQIHKVGVDIFRLNFSHGEHATHGATVQAIRDVESRSGTPITIFADLQGPKFRCGDFEQGGITLKYGSEVKLLAGGSASAPNEIPIPHENLLCVLEEGDVIRLDDGKLQLTVSSRQSDDVIARVDTPGILKSRKGINVPGRTIPVSALTDKDRDDLAFALTTPIDYVALSFVQRQEDVAEARAIIGDRVGIITKIEKPTAVEDLDGILALSDGIMVARGDLGVECPPEYVPLIQRRIVRECREAGKPVIVATHMLESMVDSPAPTRAEASDVSNAVMQGADAVMLSAESAVGRHPSSAVAIMDRIIKAAEGDAEFWYNRERTEISPNLSTEDSISAAARGIAEADDCKLVVAFTASGATARRISRQRPQSPVLAVVPDIKVARKLVLGWGLIPIVSKDTHDFLDMVDKAEALAISTEIVKKGERIVIVAGYPFGRVGTTNTLKVSRL